MAGIFLVIKGSRASADAACHAEGVEWVFDGESTNHNECYGYAECDALPRVVAWYAKDCGTTFPLLDGSLLWYAVREAK